MANRLARETSPYLLQHKDNPVDWYPWGDEALECARNEDKPILLSVGYAACHWCHVMEHESFEDHETAAIMNDHFVCVKVDREERPDIDAIYMEAVQVMTGHGGWPMTVFLTPDGVPFYGGTYFPPEDRHGLPSFKRLLLAVADTWAGRRSDVELQGKQLLEHLDVSDSLEASDDPINATSLQHAYEALEATFDPHYGGFGGAPKFPQPTTIDLLLRLARRGYEHAAGMAKKTLDAMASGGMFDQLGGGFHRYSVDRQWVVPHFEKMLYDNAQLLATYARSFLVTGDERHREVAVATAEWMLREMRDPAGGFWSSLDADSEGEEGKFYVWSLDEVREVTGDDAEVAVARWGFAEQGNFEGHNIPVLGDPAQHRVAVERARSALLERRETRVRPGADTKVITSWNCLAIAAFAEAGVALAEPGWIDAAREAMDFVVEELRRDRRLMRSYRRSESGEGVVRHLAFCEDYAYFVEAALALFEATHEVRWLDEARWAADESVRLFHDDRAGGFYTTGSDAEPLVTRPKDFFDSPMASTNSVLAVELQRLALLTGERRYEELAVEPIRLMRQAAVRSPTGFGHLLSAIDFYTSNPLEIVVVGDTHAAETQALLDVVRSRFLPNKVLVVAGAGEVDELAVRVPLLDGRTSRDGPATAYVCRQGVCRMPVSAADALVAELQDE